MPKLRNLKYKDVLRLLRSQGFVQLRQEGSHVAFRGQQNQIVIVPQHGNKIIPLGTVLSLLRQAKIDKFIAKKYFEG